MRTHVKLHSWRQQIAALSPKMDRELGVKYWRHFLRRTGIWRVIWERGRMKSLRYSTRLLSPSEVDSFSTISSLFYGFTALSKSRLPTSLAKVHAARFVRKSIFLMLFLFKATSIPSNSPNQEASQPYSHHRTKRIDQRTWTTPVAHAE